MILFKSEYHENFLYYSYRDSSLFWITILPERNTTFGIDLEWNEVIKLI